MLSSLHIENIAVIKNADIDFSKGFHVLTGETGAGKSILIDSINLILGSKPHKDIIRSGEKNALVCAMFTDVDPNLFADCEIKPDDDGCMYVSRVIDIDGKNVTKINGRTVPVSLQKQIIPQLINIHGQNDNRILFSTQSHMEYLDSYAMVSELLKEYADAYSKCEEIKKKIQSLKRDDKEKQRTLELLKYQVNEIDEAKLKKGEEEALNTRKEKVKNSEKIIKNSRLIVKALYRTDKTLSAYELVKKSITALNAISDYVPKCDEYVEKLQNMTYDLEEIALSAAELSDGSYEDPEAEIDLIESRLDMISRLKRKYGSSVDEIIDYRDKASGQIKEIELSDVMIEDLKTELGKYYRDAQELSEKLTDIRKEAALKLEKQVVNELSYLEMPKVRFKVDIRPIYNAEGKARLSKYGANEIEFLISANVGEELKPLNKIASGGELSRIMLALKNINSYDGEGQCLIFDEIDTGVSGKTSQKIGIRLRELSRHHQVICVTHSAQIASEAHHQYLISKSEANGRVQTNVTLLDRQGRINELARIMGGVQITDKLLESAKEMLDNAGKQILEV